MSTGLNLSGGEVVKLANGMREGMISEVQMIAEVPMFEVDGPFLTPLLRISSGITLLIT